MGGIVQKSKEKIKKLKTNHEAKIIKHQNKEGSEEKINEVDYDEDVIEAANLAIAIQKEDYTTNIELSLACENLPRMDTFSQTDPMIVVYLDKEGKWVEFGKTEVIPETIFPKFMKTFVVSYNFEKPQKLRFEIYDIDSFQDKNDLEKQDYIGFVETELHEIICSPTQSIFKPILNPNNKRRKNGVLIVKGCEFDINSSKYVFKFSAKNVSSKAELFIRLYTLNENQEFIPVISTDIMKNSKKNYYDWSPIVVASAKILNESDPIRFELCEFNKSKGNLYLGDCEISLEKLLKKSLSSINILKNNWVIGQLNIEANKIVRHTFLNYIYAGTEVSLIVGIDFSKSNKNPWEYDSLHKISENNENDYINALKSIVEILQYYDHDNKIPVYGFGAKLPPSYGIVSQCFALNGNFFSPEVYGLEEVLNIYLQTVKNVKFHGPQIFSEILNMAGMYASAEKITNTNQKYYILLMITNGFISDFEFTYYKIKELSVLPLSIIIVGIGEGYGKSKDGADINYFSMLQDLRKIPGSFRNIVQFVKFNDVKDDREKIAKETLASVPKQFVEFMNKNNIEPLIQNESKGKSSFRDFKQFKLEEMKSKMKSHISLNQNITPAFLIEIKEKLAEKLITAFNYDPKIIDYLLETHGVPTNDITLIFEILNEIAKKTKNNSTKIKAISQTFEKEFEEKLKNAYFIKNPHVKHRFFRSRNGKNYNFYDKIKKKSENLDETKRILDQQNKRIYESPAYERKQKKIHDNNSSNSQRNSLDSKHKSSEKKEKSNFFSLEKENHEKTQRNSIENQEKTSLFGEKSKENTINKEKIKEKSPLISEETREKTHKKAENNLSPKKKKNFRTKVLGKTSKKPTNYDEFLYEYDPLTGSLDPSLCRSCQNAKIEVLCLPCGHLCFCQDCFAQSSKTCLFCNTQVKNYVILDTRKKKSLDDN